MSTHESIYLASRSPRRLQLLMQIGIKPIVIESNVMELQLPSEAAPDYANRIALNKAEAGWEIAEKMLSLPVIAADTIVVCEDRILGKPRDREDAIATLNLLSGRTHQVITAVAIKNATKTRQCLVESEVTFAHLTASQIEFYWNTGEASDKAGAYGIQGLAAAFISRLKGSYSAVAGLPLYETSVLLRDFGIKVLGPDK